MVKWMKSFITSVRQKAEEKKACLKTDRGVAQWSGLKPFTEKCEGKKYVLWYLIKSHTETVLPI